MKPGTRLLQGLRNGLLLSVVPEGEIPAGGGGEQQDSAPAPAPEPAPAAPEPAAAAAPEPAPAASPAPVPKKDWKEERIGALTAKAAKKDEEIERLTRELEEARAGNPDLVPRSEIEALAAKKAAEDAAAAAWNTSMNEMIRAGREEFKEDFNTSVSTVRGMIDPKDPVEVAQYRTLLAAAHETGQGHLIIHALGKDPGRLQELLTEPALKMTVSVAKMAGELGKAPEPSAAPRAITPVRSSGIHYEAIKPDDKDRGTDIPIAEWMKRREEQARKAGIQ